MKLIISLITFLIAFSSINAQQDSVVDNRIFYWYPLVYTLPWDKCTPLSKLKLTDVLEIKSEKEIFKDINKLLSKSSSKDTILGVYKNNQKSISGKAWPLVRDSILNNEPNEIKQDIGYYTIEKGYFWYTTFSDSFWRMLSDVPGWICERNINEIASNKLKACYWIWQIYTQEYDSSDAAYLMKKSKEEWDSTYFDYCSNLYFGKKIYKVCDSPFYDSLYTGNPLFFKNKEYANIDSIFASHLAWIKEVEKYGIKKIREKKISPLPEGFYWEKFEVDILCD